MLPTSWREKHTRGTLSALVSCIVHTALFIALALTYFANQPAPPATLVIQAALAGPDDEVALDFSEQVNLDAPKLDEAAAPTPQSNTDFDLNIQSH